MHACIVLVCRFGAGFCFFFVVVVACFLQWLLPINSPSYRATQPRKKTMCSNTSHTRTCAHAHLCVLLYFSLAWIRDVGLVELLNLQTAMLLLLLLCSGLGCWWGLLWLWTKQKPKQGTKKGTTILLSRVLLRDIPCWADSCMVVILRVCHSCKEVMALPKSCCPFCPTPNATNQGVEACVVRINIERYSKKPLIRAPTHTHARHKTTANRPNSQPQQAKGTKG